MPNKKPIPNPPCPSLTKGDMMRIFSDGAIRYRAQGIAKSLQRNRHMHTFSGKVGGRDENLIDAVLVDFLNWIGMEQGLDYGMYTKYLSWELWSASCQYRLAKHDTGATYGDACSCPDSKTVKWRKTGQPLCRKRGCPAWREPPSFK